MYCQKNLNRLFSQDLPIDLKELPESACLVGGAVRDALLNRHKDYVDLDFVVPEGAIETAKAIANRYRAGFVVLDSVRQIARVVFERGTLDFARREGQTLEIDLKRRDFTVNAIAYNPHTQDLIDPLGGLTDLHQKCLRMVSKENLQDDPLRLLRAYRQSAQLDFEIECHTAITIRSLANLLGGVAAERVQSELNYLLLNPRGDEWLKRAWQDGLFQAWLSRITDRKIAQVMGIAKTAQWLESAMGDRFLFSATSRQMAKLALLVSSVTEEAEKELSHLKYSRLEIRTVLTALKNLPRLERGGELSRQDRYFLFVEVGKIFPVFALVAVAVGIDPHQILSLFQSYLDPGDPIAHPQTLLTGNDLIAHLGLKPSPLIGKLLIEVQIAQIEGKVTSFEGAIAEARKRLEHSRSGV
jgi:tRNA nucleotidyltransferase (CCA-adding enzyme)